ncbi:MAG: aerial mycelium formation protein [Mycobacteriales bacterium]
MESPSHGNRRIDRVLAPDFLDRIAEVSMAELRTYRDDALQEETDLSYIRRLVQGRMDIIQAELDRRDGAGTGSLIDALPGILADDGERAPAHGLGRHSVVEPSRAAEHRRYVEQLVADVDLSDVGAREPAELMTVLEALRDEEEELSMKRRQVQRVVDACSAEVTRRYRDGEADAGQLLDEQQQH